MNKEREEIYNWLVDNMYNESKPITDMFNLCIENEDFAGGAVIAKKLSKSKADLKLIEEELEDFVYSEFGEVFNAMEEESYFDGRK